MSVHGKDRQMSAVEVMAAKSVGSDAPSKVFDIWIEPDGTASYTCGFFDGETEAVHNQPSSQ